MTLTQIRCADCGGKNVDGYRPTVYPLIIPIVYCHINSFQRVASVEKPEPGGEKRRGGGGQRIPWNGEAMGSFSSRVCHRGVPERERVPDRCHASGTAVDVCSDALIWAQRAERTADGGVVDVARDLSGSPRAP